MIDELARIKQKTDNRPESFLRLLEERAKELVPDYPYSKNDAFEWLWAITSSLEGTELARQDWEKEAARLKYRLNHQTEDDIEACRQGKHTD